MSCLSVSLHSTGFALLRELCWGTPLNVSQTFFYVSVVFMGSLVSPSLRTVVVYKPHVRIITLRPYRKKTIITPAPVPGGATNLEKRLSQGPRRNEAPCSMAERASVSIACAGQENRRCPRVIHCELSKRRPRSCKGVRAQHRLQINLHAAVLHVHTILEREGAGIAAVGANINSASCSTNNTRPSIP